jgi:hypothetical protein
VSSLRIGHRLPGQARRAGCRSRPLLRPLVRLAAPGATAWQAVDVTERQASPDVAWLPLPEAAEALQVGASKVRQMVRDHELAMVRREGVREPEVPAEFILDGLVVKGLAGTLTLLHDRGLDDREAIDWLFAADESLPGRPIDALRENRGREVRRRAQVVI